MPGSSCPHEKQQSTASGVSVGPDLVDGTILPLQRACVHGFAFMTLALS
jgi:hypothetical protein